MLLSCLGIAVYATRLFPGYAQRRAFLPLPSSSSSSLAYCRRHGRASGGPLAVLPKIESTGAEPAPLARALLLIGSRARLSRRLRHGSGIGTRSRHTFGLRNSGRAVVSHRSRSVPHHAPRKHQSSPSVDDPKLRLDAGGSNPAQPVAVHAVRPRLALPAFLHHSLLAMLGAEFADRGMDGSETQAAVPVPELSIKGGSPVNLCARW
jgi:hypothetical protein